MENVISLVALLLIVNVGILLIGAVENSYDCETLPGYDSSGTTPAEMYPPNTWAGVCEEIKNDEKQKRLNIAVMVSIAVTVIWILMTVLRQR